jgi:hypothetical protein
MAQRSAQALTCLAQDLLEIRKAELESLPRREHLEVRTFCPKPDVSDDGMADQDLGDQVVLVGKRCKLKRRDTQHFAAPRIRSRVHLGLHGGGRLGRERR